MADSIKLQLKTAVENTTGLKRINELIFDLQFSGTGSDCTKITLGTTLAGVVVAKLTSGSFYAEQAGITNQGSAKTLGLGNNTLFFKVSQDSQLIIENTNYVNTFTEYARTANAPIVKIDFLNFKYLRSLVTLAATFYFSGLIDNLSLLTGLGNVSLFNSQLVKGNLAFAKNLLNLTAIQVYTTGLYGDISNLGALTKLQTLNLSNTTVSGNLSVLSGITTLKSIVLNSTFVQGDASVIYNKPALTALNLDGITNGITWETSLPCSQTGLITLTIKDCILSDAHLNNALVSLSSATWTGSKTLFLKANQGYVLTSAGSSAIDAIKGKGVTVTINGVVV